MGTLRFLLAASVVLAHSSSIFGFTLVDSDVAVESFFIISGFYMALILNEKYIGDKQSYKLFITNRFLRLYPVYWVMLFLTVLASVILTYNGGTDTSNVFRNYQSHFSAMRIESAVFLLFTNAFIFFQDLAMFLGINSDTGGLYFVPNIREVSLPLYLFLFVPQAWTLGIELVFYLIAPFIARRHLGAIILLAIASVCVRFVLAANGLENDPWSYRFILSELVFFFLGILAYKVYAAIKTRHIKLTYMMAAFLVIVAFTITFGFFPVQFKKLSYFALFFCSIPFVFLLTKGWKWDNYIGELSYPIYISHMFVLLCVESFNVDTLGLTILSLTTLVSILLYETVVKKIEELRRERFNKIGHLQFFHQDVK